MAKAAKKKEEVVSLETVLWNCRVALRGVGSTDKNRDAVIGLCFLKFAGDKFEKRRAELIAQYGDIPETFSDSTGKLSGIVFLCGTDRLYTFCGPSLPYVGAGTAGKAVGSGI